MQDDATKAQVQAMYESTEFERLRDAIQKEIARSRLQLRDDRDLFAGTCALGGYANSTLVPPSNSRTPLWTTQI